MPECASCRTHDRLGCASAGDAEITFHVYQRDGRTVVFWQEGEIVCVLVGDGAPEDVIALAFAKAMKV